jgi:hypothetical protein
MLTKKNETKRYASMGAAAGGESDELHHRRKSSREKTHPIRSSRAVQKWKNIHRARALAAPWMLDPPMITHSMIAHSPNLHCKNFFYPRNTQPQR